MSQKEIKKFQVIKIDYYKTRIPLYFFLKVKCFKNCFTRDDNEDTFLRRMIDMTRLYQRGSDRINSELNMVKLIKNLRNLVVMFDKNLKNDEMEFNALFDKKNVIDID